MISLFLRKGLSILIFAGLILYSLSSVAVINTAEGIPDEEYRAYVEYSKLAPGNLSKDRDTFSKLSASQLKQLVEGFNVSHFGFLHPLKVAGNKIPSVLNRKIEELSVMAVWDGTMKPIPFQFDEYDIKSRYIFIPGINTNPVDGVYGQVDPNDDLIFLFRDASEKRYDANSMALDEGKILKELKFTDRQGRDRYAYLVEHNSKRSDVDYIRYNQTEDNSNIDTAFFNLDFNPENFLDFKDLSNNYGSDAHHSIMDQIYFDVSANIFSDFIKIGLNSFDNVRVKILGVKDGPVRATVYSKIYFVLAGIRLFGMNSEVSFYEQGLVFPNRTEVGKGTVLAGLIKNPKILVYCDLDIEGGKLTSQAFVGKSGDRLFANVDGAMDAEEREATEFDLPGNWVWVEHGDGWEVVATFKLSDAAFDGMKTSIFYVDDKGISTEHEKIPGALPHIGILMKGLPEDMAGLEKLDMEYAFWFTDTVGDGGPLEFYKDEQNPPSINVADIEPINPSTHSESLVLN